MERNKWKNQSNVPWKIWFERHKLCAKWKIFHKRMESDGVKWEKKDYFGLFSYYYYQFIVCCSDVVDCIAAMNVVDTQWMLLITHFTLCFFALRSLFSLSASPISTSDSSKTWMELVIHSSLFEFELRIYYFHELNCPRSSTNEGRRECLMKIGTQTHRIPWIPSISARQY